MRINASLSSLPLLCVMAVHLETFKMFSECKDVIGLENGAVLDSMISASSSYHVDHTGPERARLNWVYGKFYFDIIYIILAQRGQDSIGYMVSSTLILR